MCEAASSKLNRSTEDQPRQVVRCSKSPSKCARNLLEITPAVVTWTWTSAMSLGQVRRVAPELPSGVKKQVLREAPKENWRHPVPGDKVLGIKPSSKRVQWLDRFDSGVGGMASSSVSIKDTPGQLDVFLEQMEGRLEAMLAKHHQTMLEKILAALSQRSSEGRGAHGWHRGPGSLSVPKPKKKTTGSLVSEGSLSVETVRRMTSDTVPRVREVAKAASRQSPKLKQKHKVPSVPSIMALESAMLHNLGHVGSPKERSVSLSSQNDNRPSHGSEEPGPGSPSRKDGRMSPVPAVPAAPASSLIRLREGQVEITSPELGDLPQQPEFDRMDSENKQPRLSGGSIMGMPRDPNVKVTATKIGVLMKDSQSAILAEIDDGALQEEGDFFGWWPHREAENRKRCWKWGCLAMEVKLDVGSKAMLAIPSFVPTLLAVLSASTFLSMIAASLWVSHIHVHSKLFVIFTTGLYGALGVACVRLMQAALRHLALHRLNLFISEFELEWSELSGQQWRRYVLVWVLLCSTQVATQGIQYYLLDHLDQSERPEHASIIKGLGMFSVISFAAGSATIMITCFVLSHIILGMDSALDCWCCHILNTPNFEFGVVSWNNLQALLKCVGHEVDKTFILVQVLSSLGFMYLLTNGVTYVFRADQLNFLPTLAEGLAALPLIFLFGLSMRLFSHGASLTEKCKFIPSFVNQIPTEDPIDLDKQFLVNFVTSSNAGFFVRNVRLTQEMFVKQFVLVCGLLSGDPTWMTLRGPVSDLHLRQRSEAENQAGKARLFFLPAGTS
eukprot:s65_g5.t1